MLPNGVRIVGLLLAAWAGGCAATASSTPAPVSTPADDAQRAEVQSLRGELERAREEVRVLRGRVALAEAESRDLRGGRSLVEQRRTVTIGGGAPATDIDWIEPELAQDEAWIAEEEAPEPPSGPRIVLADDPAPLPVAAAPRASIPPPRVAPTPVARAIVPPALPAAPVPAVAATPAADGSTRYRAALEAVRARRLDEALRLFEAFLETYPRHEYADNALYWQGEIHYVAGRFQEARGAYERIVRDHGAGNKVSDALLRLGVCAQRLGETERARAYFRELRARFPESPAARRAPQEAT